MQKSSKKKAVSAKSPGMNDCLKQVALNPNQKIYLDKILNNDVTFCYGFNYHHLDEDPLRI